MAGTYEGVVWWKHWWWRSCVAAALSQPALEPTAALPHTLPSSCLYLCATSTNVVCVSYLYQYSLTQKYTLFQSITLRCLLCSIATAHFLQWGDKSIKVNVAVFQCQCNGAWCIGSGGSILVYGLFVGGCVYNYQWSGGGRSWVEVDHQTAPKCYCSPFHTQKFSFTENCNSFCFWLKIATASVFIHFPTFPTLTFQLHPHVETFLESEITWLVLQRFYNVRIKKRCWN